MKWKHILSLHSKKKKVGLVLGSGGAKGLSHIGVIKFLEEMNVKIDFITGSSIGALIGGAYASGLSINKIEDIALAIDLKTTAKLFSPGFGKSGLVTGSKVQEFLASTFGNKNIEDLKIPFVAIATDIITGKEIHLNKGYLAEAIRASISIPVVFQPVIWNNIVLVDGGLVNPVPINLGREMGADYIIAVNVLASKNKPSATIDKKFDSKIDLEKPLEIIPVLQKKLEDLIIDHKWIKTFIKHNETENLPGIKKIFNRSVQITQEKLVELSVELYEPDVLIEPEVENINIFDFYKAEEIIKRGYKAAETVLKKNKIGKIPQ
ncbi:MAG: patatin-like phospholipase family protein [Candidatus Cloacimonadota bacterium]|nr:patatin-like phospholipase family protein [Candidatus Cloacimonadota bacterium]